MRGALGTRCPAAKNRSALAHDRRSMLLTKWPFCLLEPSLAAWLLVPLLFRCCWRQMRKERWYELGAGFECYDDD